MINFHHTQKHENSKKKGKEISHTEDTHANATKLILSQDN